MSYDPTQWAPQTPGQQPAQPPVTPPAQPDYGQAPQPQYPPVAPTAYGQPQPQQPAAPYGQPSSPSYPPVGQPSNPGYPPVGQPSSPSYPPIGQPSSPGYPPVGQPSSPSYPQYGQPSNPGYPPVGQPSSPSYPPLGQPSSPGYPQYGQPGEQQAWGAVPPGFVPPTAPPKKKNTGMIVLIVIVLVVVLGGGGGFAGYSYWLSTRPKPVITVTSKYLDGNTAVGATSTDGFTVNGTDFTASSAITFFSNNLAFPSTTPIMSNDKGVVTATLTVGPAWAPGTYTITAKDAAGYTTKLGVKIEIVAAGKNNTPGPAGAPTDSANMIITADVTVGGNSDTIPLTVKNGSVCGSNDDGQAHSSNHTGSNGTTYVETITQSCSGTYAAGKLTYTETVSTLKVVYSDGLICKVDKPFANRHLEGTFSDGTTLSGTYSSDALTFVCNLGVGNLPISAQSGTWNGKAIVS